MLGLTGFGGQFYRNRKVANATARIEGVLTRHANKKACKVYRLKQSKLKGIVSIFAAIAHAAIIPKSDLPATKGASLTLITLRSF